MLFRLPLFLVVSTFSVSLVFGTDRTGKALKGLPELCKIDSDQRDDILFAAENAKAAFLKKLEEAQVQAIKRVLARLNEIRKNASELTTKKSRQTGATGEQCAQDIVKELAVGGSEFLELHPAQSSPFGPMGNGQPIKKRTLFWAIARCQKWPSKEVTDAEIADKIKYVRGLDSIDQQEILEQGAWFVKTLDHRGFYQVWECVNGTPNNYQWIEIIGVFAKVYIDQTTMANRLLRVSCIREKVVFNYVKDYSELIDPIVFGRRCTDPITNKASEQVRFQKNPFAVLFPNGFIPTLLHIFKPYPLGTDFGPSAGYYVICRPNENGEINFDYNNNIAIRRIPGILAISEMFQGLPYLRASLPIV